MDRPHETLKVIDFDVEDLFSGESRDWQYAIDAARFSHREACEFMFFLFPAPEQEAHFNDEVAAAERFGCSGDFIECLRWARAQGAHWAMFHV